MVFPCRDSVLLLCRDKGFPCRNREGHDKRSGVATGLTLDKDYMS